MKTWLRRTLFTAAASLGLVATAVGAFFAADAAYPPPLVAPAASPEVLDRDGVLLRAFAAPNGRWRLAMHLDEVDPAFIDMERKFVVPLVRGNRVRSLVVADLRLEVRASGESRALALKPKVRDAFLDTLYAMAVAGAFDGDLYSNNVQDEMRARLLQAARQVLQDDASAILIAELLRQDQ